MAWPAYITINETNVEYIANYSDSLASIVLGEDDEHLLRTRFGKKVGPWAPHICDPAGTYMRSLAEEHYNRITALKSTEVVTEQTAKTLADSVETNTKNRKREAAMKALAKRAPRKKARCAAPVAIIATGLDVLAAPPAPEPAVLADEPPRAPPL